MIYSTFIPALWCVEFNQTLNERAREFMFCQNDRFSTIASTLRLCQSRWWMQRQKERREKERESRANKAHESDLHTRRVHTADKYCCHSSSERQFMFWHTVQLFTGATNPIHSWLIQLVQKHNYITGIEHSKYKFCILFSAFSGIHTHTICTVYIRSFLRSFIQNTLFFRALVE